MVFVPILAGTLRLQEDFYTERLYMYVLSKGWHVCKEKCHGRQMSTSNKDSVWTGLADPCPRCGMQSENLPWPTSFVAWLGTCRSPMRKHRTRPRTHTWLPGFDRTFYRGWLVIQHRGHSASRYLTKELEPMPLSVWHEVSTLISWQKDVDSWLITTSPGLNWTSFLYLDLPTMAMENACLLAGFIDEKP